MKKILFFTIISIFVFTLVALLGINLLNQNDIIHPEQKYQEIIKVNNPEPTPQNNQENIVETIGKSVNKKESTFSLIYPVEGELGMVHSPDKLIYSHTLQEWTTHQGIDIQAKRGTPVKAAESGVIENITETADRGIEITISHENGYKTIYSNLSTRSMVNPGQRIEKAQVISGIGNTASFEYSEPSHLHFEIIKNGKNVNPLEELT